MTQEKITRLDDIDTYSGGLQESIYDHYDVFRTMMKNSGHLDDIDVAEYLGLCKKMNKMLRSYRVKLNIKMKMYGQSTDQTIQ